MLPALGGVLPAETENDENIKQFAYAGPIEFSEMLKNLLQLAGKEDEYYQKSKTKKVEKNRKLEEITDYKKFK